MAGWLFSCEDTLETWQETKHIISPPSEKTIAFLSYNHTLCISNNKRTKYFHLTFYPATEHDWSPDKHWLCFVKDFQIWKIKYNGRENRRLTPLQMTCEMPRFSPDGRKIIFLANRDSPTEFIADIYIINSDGSNLKKITSSSMISDGYEYNFGWPDWLKKGRDIIFCYGKVRIDPLQFKSHVAILNLETNKLRVISSIDEFLPFFPRPSPTRDEFLFVREISRQYGGTDIYRSNLDGTEVIKLTDNGHSWFPDWFYNGEKFIYNYTDENRNATMRVMNRNGTGDQQLKIDHNIFGRSPNW